MPPVMSALLTFVVALCRSRASLCLENLALRHQVAVYQQTIPRPRLRPTDRLFWAWLSRLWPGWQEALAFVQPRTVIAWQRQRFRDHWRRLSQQGTPGRPAIAQGGTRAHPHDVAGESDLGFAADRRGTRGSWALTWPNPRWRSIGYARGSHRHRRGRPFSRITCRIWWPSISLSCRP